MDVLKRLHTSVAQSFENSFDNAYRDLNAEFARRDERVTEAEQAAKVADEAHREANTRVEELQRKIMELKEELHPCELDGKSKKFKTSMQATYGPEHILENLDGSDMKDLQPHVKSQIADVGTKYRALYGDFQDLIGVCGTLRTKIDSHKQKLMQWQIFISQEEFTIEISGVPTTFKRVHGAANTNDRLPPKSKRSTSEASKSVGHRAKTEGPMPNSVQPEPTSTGSSRGGDGRKKSSGAGQGPFLDMELQESVPTALDPSLRSDETVSDDIASSISNGTVTATSKRRRVSLPEPGPQISSSLDESKHTKVQQPIVIKSESMSSSPLRDPSEYQPPIGTQDLDEVGSSVETPKKKNRHNPDYRQQHNPPAINVFEIREPEGDHEDPRCHESEQRTPKRPRVLQPIDRNLPAIQFPCQQSSTKPNKSRHAIPSIAEDGENFMDLDTWRRNENHAFPVDTEQPLLRTSNAPTRQRLQDLLEGAAPSKSPLHAQPSPRLPVSNRDHSRRDSHGAVGNKPTGIQSRGPAEKPKSLQAMHEPRTRAGLASIRGSLSTEAPLDSAELREPYRAWPLDRLEPNHFKINPNYNHGLEYAFDSVVRKKDERKCVAGCTRPGCCGDKFLAMARIGGLPTNLDGPYRETEEQRILEEYLGEEKHLLDTISPRDREGLLHEAQARRIANVHGKHRQSHQRPRTPPGFWRTEMPDTQELERDRKEARELERETVYERYREARRPNGLWKFADE